MFVELENDELLTESFFQDQILNFWITTAL